MSKTTRYALIGAAIAFTTVFLVPAMLRAFAFGMKGEYDPAVIKNRIDSRTCEFVLTPKRDESFMRCPIPKDFKIPNWPDKEAPLNKGTK